MKLKHLKLSLALVVGAAWTMALQPVDGSDWYCGGCWAGAMPATQHFPALPPSTCGVRFQLVKSDGVCENVLPEPLKDCESTKACTFGYQVICQGSCGNVVPGLFALGGTALPLYTPCGTYQHLGDLACGASTTVDFFVYDVTSGATAVKTSLIWCTSCELTDKTY